MVDFGDVGRICLNGEIKGDCENCPWWEWNPGKQQCDNAENPICPHYREKLLDTESH